MNPSQLVERIHASGRQMVLAITGGGSGAISQLLVVPGGSATILEAVVPYSAVALQRWLGGPPNHYCSEYAARAMAMAAYERARLVSTADPRLLRGIGATASLVSNRPKRGPHRVHVAWQSAERTAVISCKMVKGARSRFEEEQLATQLVLSAVADACGVGDCTRDSVAKDIVSPASRSDRDSCESAVTSFESLAVQPTFGQGERISRRDKHAPSSWTELLLGERTHVAIPEVASTLPATSRVLFPGAFNPLHQGHRRMAQIATERLGEAVTFELSIANVDKPPLDFLEIADRLRQFTFEPVWLTRAARFVEKAALAPGCTFVVGADTIARIGDPKYYHDGEAQRDAAVEAIARAGCRFLVFGRLMHDAFQTLKSISIPRALLNRCDEVPEADFRDDISSTQLRGG